MITKITMKNIATFKEVVIDNLSKINFIYGANGTGKTTLSNFLTNQEYCKDCNIEWENGREYDILVYNKKFKDDNFYSDNLII